MSMEEIQRCVKGCRTVSGFISLYTDLVKSHPPHYRKCPHSLYCYDALLPMDLAHLIGCYTYGMHVNYTGLLCHRPDYFSLINIRNYQIVNFALQRELFIANLVGNNAYFSVMGNSHLAVVLRLHLTNLLRNPSTISMSYF